jgi:hypothetical protein
MDGIDSGSDSIEGNILKWCFEGYEVERRIVGAVRDGREGDVLYLTTFLHIVL